MKKGLIMDVYELTSTVDGKTYQISVGTADEMLEAMAREARQTVDSTIPYSYSVHKADVEWISRNAAMNMLGIGRARLSQLVKKGQITADGRLVKLRDVIKQKQFAGKSGARRKIKVWAPNEDLYTMDVVESFDLGDAELVLAWFDELGEELAVILWDDGTTMTTKDWQGDQPNDPSEIEDYEWVVVEENGWFPTVMLDGLPRAARF